MNKKRWPVYLGNLFFGFHYYLIIYINSNFLSQYVNDSQINILYTAGAILNILFLSFIPRFLNKINAKHLLLFIIVAEFAAVFALSSLTNPLLLVIAFIAYQAVGPLIFYCSDLFLENSMHEEKNTGFVRAVYLTMINIPIIISFYVVSLIASSSFSLMYVLSALCLIPLSLTVMFKFSNRIHKNKIFAPKDVLSFLMKDMDALRILVCNFLLHLFYAIMVIYLPLLLYKTALFSWSEIGKILIIMILPFVLFEMPLGRLFDKKTGEKEFLTVGFIIISVATFTLSFLNGNIFWMWALVLFVSRIGASFVEIANESYFFKRVTDRDSGVISLFRATGPIAIIVSPVVAIPALIFTSYSGLFFILSLITLLGLLFVPKVDTH